MKRILIVLYLLLGVVTARAQYPANLPSSGAISLQQVSNWMLAAGEIGGNNYSMSYLNGASHLADKTAPYSLSDWYGYGCITNAGSVSGAPATICDGSNVTYTLNGITGNFLRFQYQWNTTGGAWNDWGTTNPYTWSSGNAGNTLYVRGVAGMGNCLAYSAAVGTTVNSLSAAPTGISGTTSIALGASTTLSASGGSLGTGANWKWYSGSCGGTYLGAGSSITVTPGSTTNYYVRAEGSCNTTACASTTVTVPTCFTPSISSVSFSGSRASGIYVNIVGVMGSGAAWTFLVSFYTGYPSNQYVSFTVTTSNASTLVGSGFPSAVTITNFKNVSSCGVSSYAGGWSQTFN